MIFREVKRVLKPHGNCFVVIDDTYSGSGKGYGSIDPKYPKARDTRNVIRPNRFKIDIPNKCLCLVPELFAIRMVYDLGFILRNKIIWAKKIHIYKERKTIGNAMPESVKDRLTHTWEYIYHFVKEPKYYYDLDGVRIPIKDETIRRMQRAERLIKRTGFPITPNNKYYQALIDGTINEYGQAGILTGRFLTKHDRAVGRVGNFSYTDPLHTKEHHPLGANPGDVLQINTEPFPEAHFSVYPEQLVEFLIKVGSPQEICKKCGKPRERIVERGEFVRTGGKRVKDTPAVSERQKREGTGYHQLFMIGWTDCGCNAGWEAGVVLDPFLGSGTTALVALKLGRRFVGIEINREYCEMALRRIEPYLKQRKLEEFS